MVFLLPPHRRSVQCMELARGRAQARGMLVRLAGTGLLLGAAAFIVVKSRKHKSEQ